MVLMVAIPPRQTPGPFVSVTTGPLVEFVLKQFLTSFPVLYLCFYVTLGPFLVVPSRPRPYLRTLLPRLLGVDYPFSRDPFSGPRPPTDARPGRNSADRTDDMA